MSARRIARELAVIVLPQLPRNKSRLEKIELDTLIGRTVQMLSDYARQCLAEADAMRVKAAQQLLELEAEHPNNVENIDSLAPVPVATSVLREQLELIERAAHLVSEALDMPEISVTTGNRVTRITCKKCANIIEHREEHLQESEVLEFLGLLVSTYLENREQIDELIRHAKAKWKVERMVSIDRDILRLACAEAFFIKDVPIRVCISEAVELSHRFADDKAAKFINGVLGDIAIDAEHFRRTGQFPERPAAASEEAGEAGSPALPTKQ